jgi:hypothetical protein
MRETGDRCQMMGVYSPTNTQYPTPGTYVTP